MKKHMPSVHHIKTTAHKKSALWKDCKLQTYFTAKGLIDYFVVVDNGKSEQVPSVAAEGNRLLTDGEKAYFKKIEADLSGRPSVV
jgi:hypothetical protein